MLPLDSGLSEAFPVVPEIAVSGEVYTFLGEF